MKNSHHWTPSKYTWRKGRLVGSRDPRELSPASRLGADLVASRYEAAIPNFVRGRLLDLGCGKVPLFGAYREFVTEAICVDWANTPNRSQHLDFECDLTQSLPFRDGEFDTIILSDVLEHLPEPAHLWNEMSRLLPAGGHALVNVPFFYWLHEEPHDYYRFTEFALRRLAHGAGLHIVFLDRIGGAPEILLDILAKNLVQIPRLGASLAAMLQGIGALFLKTRFGKRVSAHTSGKFPYGYFLVATKIG
jgi:SAM-dependent methyltransferase